MLQTRHSSLPDTMSDGLDFDYNSLTVKADGTAATRTDVEGIATFKIGDTVIATAKKMVTDLIFHLLMTALLKMQLLVHFMM